MSKILVVGDVMQDVYIWGTASRLSPEAPVPVLAVKETETRWGGAANVALNIKAMGGDPILLGIGSDPEGTLFCNRFLVPGSNTVKTRGMAGRHQIFRYDQDAHPTPEQTQALWGYFQDWAPHAELVVFSDYDKGTLSRIDHMIQFCAEHGVTTIVDPKRKDWSAYVGATVITPNHSEWLAADMESKRRFLHHRGTVIETRGAEGSVLHAQDRMMHFPGMLVTEVDPTGAGDSFLAQLSVALSEKDAMGNAVFRANAAGANAVQHAGTHVVTAREIEDLIRGRQ